MRRTSCTLSLALLTVIVGCGERRTPSAPTTVTDQAAASLTSTVASAFAVPAVVNGPPEQVTAPPTVSWTCLAHAVARDTGVFSVVASPPDCPRPLEALAIGAAPFVANAPPAAPTNLTFAVTGNFVVLNWFEPCRGFATICASGAPRSYVIEVGSATGLLDLANLDTGNAATSLGIPDVPAGTYFVRVRSSNFFGISLPGNEVIINVGTRTCGSPPPAPNTLGASVTGTTITLSWNATPGGCTPTTYVLEAGSTSGASDLANFATGSTATTFAAVAPVGTYFLRVRARNGDGTSPPSNEVSVTIGQPCTPPGPPRQLTFSTTSSSTTTVLSLGWQAPSIGTPPFTYILEAGTTTGATNVFVGNIGADTSLNTQVDNGTYFIRARAVGACGTSAASNEISFTASAGPALTFAGPPGGVIAAAPGPFQYSLCRPALAGTSALCGGFTATTDPLGGRPPYHFQKPSGGRFLPFGLSLALNGLITGVLTAGGVFDVEVVDSAGNPAPSTASLSSLLFKPPSIAAAATSASRAITINVTSTALTCAVVGQSYHDTLDPNAPVSSLRFVNNSTEVRQIYWIGEYSGGSFLWDTLRPGESVTEGDTVGQRYFAADATGNCLGVYAVQATPVTVTLTGGSTTPTPTPTPTTFAGQYSGTFSAPAVGRCTAQTGTWRGTATQSGSTLTIAWFDSYHGSTQTVSATLSGSTATWRVASGDDQVDFTGTFTSTGVSGTFVGPWCTLASGYYRGTFSGQKTSGISATATATERQSARRLDRDKRFR